MSISHVNDNVYALSRQTQVPCCSIDLTEYILGLEICRVLELSLIGEIRRCCPVCHHIIS